MPRPSRNSSRPGALGPLAGLGPHRVAKLALPLGGLALARARAQRAPSFRAQPQNFFQRPQGPPQVRANKGFFCLAPELIHWFSPELSTICCSSLGSKHYIREFRKMDSAAFGCCVRTNPPCCPTCERGRGLSRQRLGTERAKPSLQVVSWRISRGARVPKSQLFQSPGPRSTWRSRRAA